MIYATAFLAAAFAIAIAIVIAGARVWTRQTAERREMRKWAKTGRQMFLEDNRNETDHRPRTWEN